GNNRRAGVMQRLDCCGAGPVYAGSNDVGMGGEQTCDSSLLRPERIVCVEVSGDVDVGILLDHTFEAVFQLSGNGSSGQTAINEDLALATELFDDPFGFDDWRASPIRFHRVSAVGGDDLIESNDEYAGVAGLL